MLKKPELETLKILAPSIMWDKPKKIQTPKEWKSSYGFDGGPEGGFVPNMSREDDMKWKGKITGLKLEVPQIELRNNGAVVIIGLRGYNYKHYRTDDKWSTTLNKNIHIAACGPIIWTLDEYDEFNTIIKEALTVLLEIDTINSKLKKDSQ